MIENIIFNLLHSSGKHVQRGANYLLDERRRKW